MCPIGFKFVDNAISLISLHDIVPPYIVQNPANRSRNRSVRLRASGRVLESVPDNSVVPMR